MCAAGVEFDEARLEVERLSGPVANGVFEAIAADVSAFVLVGAFQLVVFQIVVAHVPTS